MHVQFKNGLRASVPQAVRDPRKRESFRHRFVMNQLAANKRNPVTRYYTTSAARQNRGRIERAVAHVYFGATFLLGASGSDGECLTASTEFDWVELASEEFINCEFWCDWGGSKVVSAISSKV